MSAPKTGLPSNIETEPDLLSEEFSVEVAEERRGIRGAAVIASVAVALLFLGWLFFYFELYLRRANGG
ncbi:MAG: hypothetical protein JOZ80_13300 [Acidobacteriaceae bacterium]|nr:hypothetical protein [Acidobacteriaceae bacterium]